MMRSRAGGGGGGAPQMSSVHQVFHPIGGKDASPLSYAVAQAIMARANAYTTNFIMRRGCCVPYDDCIV
jgi:hypothetical protein